MGVRPILTWPDPRLATVCAPIGPVTDAVRGLAEDLLETMYDAPGRGLAAPQVGVLSRIFVIDVTWKEGPPRPQVFVDPEITWRSNGRRPSQEGCLSIPGITTEVPRAAGIALRWTGLDGARQERRFGGAEAICIQHEQDHLDGIVTLDRLDGAARMAAEAAYGAQP